MAEIELRGVSLTYRVYGAGSRSITGVAVRTGGLIRQGEHRHVEVDALVDVDLTASDGDRIGILGHNGAGKTTLLKVVAGILRPQGGYVRRVGATTTVINPSIGLEQDLSGYENIEQVGLLYGLSRRQIETMAPDIADFTELGDFMRLPVSTYSAGMLARLAFAVATAFHPEILVADENLGSGDAHFIAKAQQRMRAMMDRSSLLLLATHSVMTIRTLCNRVILMEHGRIVADGDVDEVLAEYSAAAAEK